MVALVFILIFLLGAALLAFDAYLLSVHVPTLIEDPSNFGAWIWLIVAVSSIIIFAASSFKINEK